MFGIKQRKAFTCLTLIGSISDASLRAIWLFNYYRDECGLIQMYDYFIHDFINIIIVVVVAVIIIIIIIIITIIVLI